MVGASTEHHQNPQRTGQRLDEVPEIMYHCFITCEVSDLFSTLVYEK